LSAIQLFDMNGELRFDGTQVGGGGSQPVLLATTNIADADILTLPTAEVELVATPGANQIIVPIHALVALKQDGNSDYGNIDANAILQLSAPNGAATLLEKVNAQAHADVSILLSNGGSEALALGPYTSVRGANYTSAENVSPDFLRGQPLQLSLSNGVAGDLNGGGAANVLVVSVLYYLLDWPT
jgi:hypothetical protein